LPATALRMMCGSVYGSCCTTRMPWMYCVLVAPSDLTTSSPRVSRSAVASVSANSVPLTQVAVELPPANAPPALLMVMVCASLVPTMYSTVRRAVVASESCTSQPTFCARPLKFSGRSAASAMAV